ncbi:MAG: hypothetical protein NWF00_06140 [Candidatus Bathyarchaeota archaeon]|nr:hypothetical protein [Candidatus Bathyarchaeota archaeon]
MRRKRITSAIRIIRIVAIVALLSLAAIEWHSPVKADTTAAINSGSELTLLSEDSGTSAKPIILVYKEKSDCTPIDYCKPAPIIYTDTGNATLWFKIRMPHDVYNADLNGDILWLGGHLTSLLYNASWQNKQIVELYANTSNSSQSNLEFNLTNIPYGEHHLQINASCVVFLLDTYNPVSSHPFYDTAKKSLYFTVAPESTPKPAASTSPTIPEFTLRAIDNSYDVSPTNSTDPITGQITNQQGYHVKNGSIVVSIRNQPFSSYYDSNSFPIKLYYQIRVKNHYDNTWHYFPESNAGAAVYFSADNSSYTVREFRHLGNSLEYKQGSLIDYPSDGKVDFQVEAFSGYFNVTNINPTNLMVHPDDLIYNYTGQTSGWSDTQTVTIPNNSSSAATSQNPSPPNSPNITPSPSIPELPFSALTITLIALATLFGTVLFRKKLRFQELR